MKCPNCGSEKVAPTAGNGVGNTMDCLVCYTDFTPPSPESVSLTVTGPNPDYSPQAEIEMWKGLLDKAEAKMVAALIERNRDAAILDALPEILAFCRKSGNVVGLVNWLRRQSDV